MRLYYEGVDITAQAGISACVVRDRAGGSADSVELELQDAGAWAGWAPAEGDRVEVTHGGYASGEMYVCRAGASGGRYRIQATALPMAARVPGNRSFDGNTLAGILEGCAHDSGMGHALHGLDGGAAIPWIARSGQTCAAFLDWLVGLEGGALKCVGGKYTAIGIAYAASLPAAATARVLDGDSGARHARLGGRLSSLTVQTAHASATARDRAATGGASAVACDLPALNAAQAGRWARGELLRRNLACEELEMQGEFSAAMTALARVDVSGSPAIAGKWLVWDAEHDLVALRTTTTLRRAVETIS